MNLYECEIGDGTTIACFVEIQRGVKVGARCKIESFAALVSGVTIEEGCLIGPHVCFTNDRYPEAGADWEVVPTVVKKGASIGAGAVIVCGVTIGEFAMVGAGAVVTHDVPPGTLVAGNPARAVRRIHPRLHVPLQ